MTAFPSRFRLFRTLASLGPLLLIWLLLLPAEAVSQPGLAVDELRTVEVPNPRGSNPLNPSEVDRAKQIAESSGQVQAAKARAADLPRPPGLKRIEDVQFLYTEHRTPDKNTNPQSRVATAVYYDYLEDTVIEVEVDLNTNAVREANVASATPDKQPFITKAETLMVLELVLKDPVVGSYVRAAYKATTGESLIDASQLEVGAQGGVFLPATADAPSPLRAVTAVCVTHRCAQVFLSVGTSFIDMSAVVIDLSKEQVLTEPGGEDPTGQTQHTH